MFTPIPTNPETTQVKNWIPAAHGPSTITIFPIIPTPLSGLPLSSTWPCLPKPYRRNAIWKKSLIKMNSKEIGKKKFRSYLVRFVVSSYTDTDSFNRISITRYSSGRLIITMQKRNCKAYVIGIGVSREKQAFGTR